MKYLLTTLSIFLIGCKTQKVNIEELYYYIFQRQPDGVSTKGVISILKYSKDTLVVFSQPVVRGSYMTPGLLKEKLREDYYFRDTFINNNGKIFSYIDNVRYPYIINNYLSDTVGRYSIKEIMVGGDNGVMLLKRQYTNGKDTLLELMKHQFYIKDNGDAFYTDSILFTFNKTKFYDTKLYFVGYSELFGDSSYLFAVRNFKSRNGKLKKAISPEDELELNKLQIDPYKW